MKQGKGHYFLTRYLLFRFSLFHFWHCYSVQMDARRVFETDVEACFKFQLVRDWLFTLTIAVLRSSFILSHSFSHKDLEPSKNLDFLPSASYSFFIILLWSFIKTASTRTLFIVFMFLVWCRSVRKPSSKFYWNSFGGALRRYRRVSEHSVRTIFLNCLGFLSETVCISDRPSIWLIRFTLSMPSSSFFSVVLGSRLQLWYQKEKIFFVYLTVDWNERSVKFFWGC